MVGVNHVATGVLVAVAIDKPVLALALAFLSHFVIDAIPHWNYKIANNPAYRQLAMAMDLTFSLSLLMILSVSLDASTRLVIACGFLALLPDAMWLPHILQGKKAPKNRNNPLHWLRKFHGWLQWSETSKGAYIEVAWFVITIFLILQLGA